MLTPTHSNSDTVFKIPKSQAILLPNETYPIIDDPGYYIASLDVFHQLHCLVQFPFLVPFDLSAHASWL
jgi:hypothetical protein